jgi:hypothetical protein
MSFSAHNPLVIISFYAIQVELMAASLNKLNTTEANGAIVPQIRTTTSFHILIHY